MQICFQNSYSALISVAVMYYDSNACTGDPPFGWATAGWWNLNPGQSVATNVHTSDGNFAFFAEAEDGAVWGGAYGPVAATPQPFQGCAGDGSSNDSLSLGMRLVQAGTGHSKCTVN